MRCRLLGGPITVGQKRRLSEVAGSDLGQIWAKNGPWPKNGKASQVKKTCEALVLLAPRPGLEPGTYGLTVRRSTD